jgi:methyl-accepting chemotaxis protein
LQETVSSVDEISAMVSKSSDAAQSSKEVSDQSRGAAQKGKETVTDMIAAIEQINESNLEITAEMEKNSREMKEIVRVITEIGNKTKVINDIVFQTKLLSFNASVEAARAGEHGKGFAVVAEEVGNLAQMSGKAADEISNMLIDSVKKVEVIAKDTGSKVEKLIVKGKEKIDQGNRVARQCEQALNLIIENVDRVNEMVSEISVATKEQSQGIQEITKAMSQLDQVTQQNASVAQFASKSSEELNKEAYMVQDIASKLNFVVNGKQSSFEKKFDEKKKHEHSNSEKTNLVALPAREVKKSESLTVESKKVVGGNDEIYGSVPSQDDPRFEEV